MQKKSSLILIYAWVIWILSAAFMFYKYVIEVSPSVMTKSLMRDFHFDATSLGNLAACYYYAYFFMQIPVGMLIDRFGPRKVTFLAILLCSVGTFFFSKATNGMEAGIFRFAIGIGASFAAVNCFKLIAAWFPHRQFAFMAGLMLTVGMLGAAGGVSPLAAFVSAKGWREALFEISLIGFVLAALFWLIVRDQKKGAKKETSVKVKSLRGLKTLLKNPQVWFLSIYSGLAFAPVSTFGGLWGVSFIEEAYQLDRSMAGHIGSLIFVGFAIGAPFFGYLSDRIGLRKPVMVWGTLCATVLMVILLYVKTIPLILFACLLFMLGFAISAFLLCFTTLREISPFLLAGTALGFMNSLDALFGAFTDPFTGFILDFVWDGTVKQGAPYFSLGNYKLGLTLLPVYLFVSLIFLYFVKETHCKEKYTPDALV